jgi:hypothetical protein
MGTTAVAAGWYKDPAGSPTLRWWDGAEWTDHVHEPVAAPQPPSAQPQLTQQQSGLGQPQFTTQPVAQPQLTQQPFAQPPFTPQPAAQPQFTPQPVAQPQFTQQYIPQRGVTIEHPRNSSLVPGYYRDDTHGGGQPGRSAQSALADTTAPHNNFVAWLSLAAGAISLGTILLVESIPSGTFIFPIFGLTAIIAGIRGIIGYRRRRVTVLWAPIVGLVLGAVAEVLLIGGIILAAIVAGSPTASNPVTPSGTIGPTGAAMNYDMGVGSVQYLPSSNLALGTAAAAESKIVGSLKLDYPSGNYPANLILHSDGDVTTSDGQDLGVIGLLQFKMGYQLESDGSYVIGLSAGDTSEAAIYLSKSDEYFAACPTDDTTCKTNSPVAPVPVSGSDSTTTNSGSSTS